MELEEERGSPTAASPAPSRGIFLAHAWSRQLFGSTNYNPPSRFIDEIPADVDRAIGAVSGRTTYGGRAIGERTTGPNHPHTDA